MNWVYNHKNWFSSIGAVLTTFAGYLIEFDGEDVVKTGLFKLGAFVDLLSFLQPYWGWIGGIGILSFVLLLAAEKFSYNQAALSFFIEAARDLAYRGVGPEKDGDVRKEHHHRVTLFRYRESWFFTFRHLGRHWSRQENCQQAWLKYMQAAADEKKGWLIPVMRANGEVVTESTVFCVTKINPDKSEGVAGQAFKTKRGLIQPDLPDLNEEGLPKSKLKQRVADYAKQTWTSESAISAKLKASSGAFPKSIGAVPLYVDNQSTPWGVIVFDSRHGKGVPKDLASRFEVTIEGIQKSLRGDI